MLSSTSNIQIRKNTFYHNNFCYIRSSWSGIWIFEKLFVILIIYPCFIVLICSLTITRNSILMSTICHVTKNFSHILINCDGNFNNTTWINLWITPTTFSMAIVICCSPNIRLFKPNICVTTSSFLLCHTLSILIIIVMNWTRN